MLLSLYYSLYKPNLLDIVSSSTGNIKTEIVLLAESQKEKASLLAYFTKHKDQQSFSDFGNFDADEDKLKYLRAS